MGQPSNAVLTTSIVVFIEAGLLHGLCWLGQRAGQPQTDTYRQISGPRPLWGAGVSLCDARRPVSSEGGQAGRGVAPCCAPASKPSRGLRAPASIPAYIPLWLCYMRECVREGEGTSFPMTERRTTIAGLLLSCCRCVKVYRCGGGRGKEMKLFITSCFWPVSCISQTSYIMYTLCHNNFDS